MKSKEPLLGRLGSAIIAPLVGRYDYISVRVTLAPECRHRSICVAPCRPPTSATPASGLGAWVLSKRGNRGARSNDVLAGGIGTMAPALRYHKRACRLHMQEESGLLPPCQIPQWLSVIQHLAARRHLSKRSHHARDDARQPAYGLISRPPPMGINGGKVPCFINTKTRCVDFAVS